MQRRQLAYKTTLDAAPLNNPRCYAFVPTARSLQARGVDCTWRSMLLIASTQRKPVSDYLLSVRKSDFFASLRFNEDGFIFLLLEEATADCQIQGCTAKCNELCIMSIYCNTQHYIVTIFTWTPSVGWSEPRLHDVALENTVSDVLNMQIVEHRTCRWE
jgi:hypothetical protein